ncbi:DUF4397 domain-containing protein [Clostridium sp. E02]|uniref:DUF4397 domain-containing protein n=1 Tax=Clostridium sp. E02 TaxID=2487134 RepID=UPI000F535FF1|nr:DUF4397 domain-containing protein [Clostridium sp. E02]
MNHHMNQTQMDMPMGYVRVIHTVPDAPNVDIYANETMVVEDLAYGEYTDYLAIPEGEYKISVYVAGTTDTPVVSNMLSVEQNKVLTIAAAGMLNDIGLLAIRDVDDPEDTDKAMVRFLHLSPNAPAVDITLPDGTVVFDDVSFKQITPYREVTPMNYTLEVRPAGTSDVVLSVPDVGLESGKNYTVYAIGLVGEEPELEAMLIQDGVFY